MAAGTQRDEVQTQDDVHEANASDLHLFAGMEPEGTKSLGQAKLIATDKRRQDQRFLIQI